VGHWELEEVARVLPRLFRRITEELRVEPGALLANGDAVIAPPSPSSPRTLTLTPDAHEMFRAMGTALKIADDSALVRRLVIEASAALNLKLWVEEEERKANGAGRINTSGTTGEPGARRAAGELPASPSLEWDEQGNPVKPKRRKKRGGEK
jgi:hypothetical protein